MIVKVGCCGWCVKGGKKAYYKVFKLIELQSTFYKLPRVETAKKWRLEAPKDFEFTMKAWQVITHPPSSPTWRKAGIKVTPSDKDKYGYLRPSEENIKAWNETLKICNALECKVCVLQTPPSFTPSEENIRNIREFFSSIRRDSILIAWEPRGKWKEVPDLVKKICDEFDIIHAVDILKWDPLSSHEVVYIRLHGLNGETNYRYKYTKSDLERLADKIIALSKDHELAYVLFNNIYMKDDAMLFREVLKSRAISSITVL
ncbi:MAG: DUF72 domain-containing protein [Thermoprotei archaeon]|mgnify:CR=1 FL=1|nr:MAG: DUF72 domain-containing protein [Thermoprotei archaeon]RLF18682.1 MAG: DUF72 domain-containing protein [Thermoprotei archaeon]